MIQTQLKLKLTSTQERQLEQWLQILTGVWNWAIRKIEQDAQNKIYYRAFDFTNLLAGHSQKLLICSQTLQAVLKDAYTAWQRCFKKIGGKPRLKGERNRLDSIPFPRPLRNKSYNKAKDGKVTLSIIGPVKYFKQDIPEGDIKCARIIKRASGWYLCLFIDADRQPIKRVAHGRVGIDPGFKDLITLSNGEKVGRPDELQRLEKRLAQAQRGVNRKLVARLHERIKNQRKDRNHKLSLQLVRENEVIVFSKDNHKAIAKKFGKSVASSAHYQLQQMLAYKSRAAGTQYIEVESRNSTKTCSSCGSVEGPTGLAGLSIRQWVCSCGERHDRDINAAMNTYKAGAGKVLENWVETPNV